MRLLLVHNYYQRPGGEDVVFAAEKTLLSQKGHDVYELTADNDEIAHTSRARAAIETIWSRSFQRILDAKIAQVRPEIIHFHNTFMVISPAAYYTAHQRGIPVVQTLHNYRLVCPAATFYRDGHICEDCRGLVAPLPSVIHSCYRQDRATSGVAAAMLTVHNLLGTWSRQVDQFLVLTEFAKQKFIELGLPSDKIVVKPNFLIDDPGIGERSGGYALFVGRLSEEKGVRTLLASWRALPDIPLKIVGDGPLMTDLQAMIASDGLTNVELLGHQTREETDALMQAAYCQIVPSEWYEGMPMTIVEAFACGAPVLASRLGAMDELVTENETGRFFTAGDPDSLATVVRQAWDSPESMARMSMNARREFLTKYTAEQNYEQLSLIYNRLQKSQQTNV